MVGKRDVFIGQRQSGERPSKVAKEEVRELVGELFEEVLSINVSETIFAIM
jgi:hypothetical protein